MGDTDNNHESGLVSAEIIRLIRENKENPKENAVRELYDKITPLYDISAVEVRYCGPTKAVALLNEYCPDKSVSILDCGAGTGIVGEELFASGYKNVVGVDFSQKSVDFAAKKGVYEKLICADVMGQKMPFNDDEFGVLICCGCIAPGHISSKCFPEWIRIVTSGGYIVMVLRRCYVELQNGEEDMYSQSFGKSFKEDIRRLEDSKGWQVVLRDTFPGYLYRNGILSNGIAFVCKVL